MPPDFNCDIQLKAQDQHEQFTSTTCATTTCSRPAQIRLKEGIFGSAEEELVGCLAKGGHAAGVQPVWCRYRLLGGKVAPGESDIDCLNRKLRRCILRVDEKQSKCEWTVGEKLSTFWRPEFDEFVYPYLPSYVQRPKECISV
ncbi:hypothetical protein FOZ60_009394 [Perkinsus olseni]|uniref:Uncharacterized protein n=1 Tax=Perkinsus olseni TaxID=32597 RepID=A0A7J6NII2_PEROL|nr:hypothetical protein FOZ60_009394 [Perkinsus olseni]